ncbi:2276_t:CDS:2 [Diversispora eburnea]|uniref:2276_t:CDS:1 n=1 Tax=Diversispora eburnea TaxID=1213867 RepID=A0A9N8ZPA1_9GLOM|nr:2276_t:CDS:2 [Diversispora eburnea]
MNIQENDMGPFNLGYVFSEAEVEFLWDSACHVKTIFVTFYAEF